ncbi:MAG: hypothetical protein NC453_21230 [Muribaculum sp.]|nr:hypothetical protein [Muribaculum sp.]
MNRTLIVIIALVDCMLSASGQEVVVEKVWQTLEPMTVPMQRKDANGQICALVKVQIPVSDVQFEGSIVGDPIFKANEYWVYIPSGTKRLDVKVPGHYTTSLLFEKLGIPIETKNIYCIKLSSKNGLEPVELAQVTPQETCSDDELFQKAITSNDWIALKSLADKGYEDAYIPLAKHYLSKAKTHDLADFYANKAKTAGNENAEEIFSILSGLGYYDW